MYISIDLGGTNTRVASSKDLKEIYKIEKFKTVYDLTEQRKLLHETISRVIDDGEAEYICIGVPGTIKRYERQIQRIKYFPGIKDMPFEEFFGGGNSGNLIIDNEASLAALAEANRGKGKDYRAVAYLTLSTGVGGAWVLDGKINNTPRNLEPGNQIIIEDGRDFRGINIKGRLEAYVSGTAFKEIYGIDPSDCDDMVIWNSYGKRLASGIINLLAMWNPQIIILGGGVSNQFEKFYKPLIQELSKQDFFEVPEIVQSDLGDENGVLGGFELISQILESK